MAYERWFPLDISRNVSLNLNKFGTQEHWGKTKTNFELGDLVLIFKVTEVIQVDDIWRMVSAQYLKECLTFPHQLWDKEAPGHDKDQVRTG